MSGARSEPMKTNRDQAMAHSDLRYLRTAKPLLLVASLAAAVLSRCAGPRDQLTTGGIPDDYRQRETWRVDVAAVTELDKPVQRIEIKTGNQCRMAPRMLHLRPFVKRHISWLPSCWEQCA